LPARTWGKYMAFAHVNVPMAKLPGNYRPANTVIPDRRPLPPLATNRSLPALNSGQLPEEIVASQRKTKNIRPTAELGQGRKRPRTIGEILFGG
jgi:hypothetical protein